MPEKVREKGEVSHFLAFGREGKALTFGTREGSKLREESDGLSTSLLSP